MISRFFKESGSPKNAVEYLLDEAKQPELMRGNPAVFEAVASALPFKNKYTSGVLRFNEKPDQSTLDSIMDEYSRFLTAGLNQPPEVLWVMHQEHGETELHFVLPNVDLESQRLFQPYLHKRDLACRDALDNTINARFGFTDPDDPANARLVNSASNYLKLSKDRKELAQTIDDFVLSQAKEALKNGFKYTSANAINDIKNIGFDVKTSRGKLSITHEEMTKPMRLKGAFYEPNFSFSQSSIEAIKSDSDRYRASSSERFEKNAKEYKRLFEQRTNHVRAKYQSAWERVAERNQKYEQAKQTADKNNVTTNPSHNNGAGSVVLPADDLDKKQIVRTLHATTRDSTSEKDPDNKGRLPIHEEQRLRVQGQSRQNDSLQASTIIPCFYLNREIGRILDQGDKLTAQAFKSDKSAAFNIVMQGKGKGWKVMQFTGNDRFLTSAFEYAIKNGIEVRAKNKHQQQILKKVLNDDGVRKDAIRTATEIGKRARDFEDGVQANSQKPNDFGQKIRQFDKAFEERAMRREDELERFKTEINLVDYAQSLGFEVVKNESTKKSVKMKSSDQTIIISTDVDNHGIYFNVNSDKAGSIIDFVQEQKNLNLGEVRKELRPFIGRDANARTEREHYMPKPLKSSKNEMAVANAFAKTEPLLTHPYLLKRGINEKTQANWIFQGKFRIDERQNVIFPHHDSKGVCGFERKNTDFTGFATGGEKGVWFSNNLKSAKKVVIVESAIDAMSYQQLNKTDETVAFISIGGQPTLKQFDILRSIEAKFNPLFVIALDNDEGGLRISGQITSQLKNGKYEHHTPPQHIKDWNDALKEHIRQQQQSQSQSLSM